MDYLVLHIFFSNFPQKKLHQVIETLGVLHCIHQGIYITRIDFWETPGRKLTWIPKLAIFERGYILKTTILGIYVRFRRVLFTRLGVDVPLIHPPTTISPFFLPVLTIPIPVPKISKNHQKSETRVDRLCERLKPCTMTRALSMNVPLHVMYCWRHRETPAQVFVWSRTSWISDKKEIHPTPTFMCLLPLTLPFSHIPGRSLGWVDDVPFSPLIWVKKLAVPLPNLNSGCYKVSPKTLS